MLPKKLDFLKRFNDFYLVTINSAKEDKINEKDFYALIRAKAKSMDQERRLKKVIRAKKGDLKY